MLRGLFSDLAEFWDLLIYLFEYYEIPGLLSLNVFLFCEHSLVLGFQLL